MSYLLFLVLTMLISAKRVQEETRSPQKSFIVGICADLCSRSGKCPYPLLVKPEQHCYSVSAESSSNALKNHVYSLRNITWQSNVMKFLSKKFVVPKIMNLCLELFSKTGNTDDEQFVNSRSSTDKMLDSLTYIHHPDLNFREGLDYGIIGYVTLKAGKDTLLVNKHDEKLNWTDAREVCRSEGGDLIKIDTLQKDTVVGKFVSKNTIKTSLWIGMTALNEEKEFRWTDGSSLGYTGWRKNEPSLGRGKCEEYCVHMAGTFRYIEWNDLNCRVKLGFICERR